MFDPSSAGTSFLYAGEFLDQNLGFYYNRARYYDPVTGRFNRLDPYLSRTIDPLRLHRYNYTAGNPINYIDSSGLDWIQGHIGSEVHREIANAYESEHSLHRIESNYYAIPGTAGKLKPDIMDYTDKAMFEIRSLNARRMADGLVKLGAYLKVANKLRVPGIPPNPERRWKSGDWQPGIRVIPLYRYPRYCAVTIGNFNGLIVYKRFRKPAKKMQLFLNSALSKALIDEMNRYTENMSVTSGQVTPGFVYAYEQYVNAIFSVAAAENMMRVAVPAISVYALSQLSTRITLATITRF